MTAADQYPAIKFTTPLAPLHGMVNVPEWKRKGTCRAERITASFALVSACCLIPGLDGAVFSEAGREARWVRLLPNAPTGQARSLTRARVVAYACARLPQTDLPGVPKAVNALGSVICALAR